VLVMLGGSTLEGASSATSLVNAGVWACDALGLLEDGGVFAAGLPVSVVGLAAGSLGNSVIVTPNAGVETDVGFACGFNVGSVPGVCGLAGASGVLTWVASPTVVPGTLESGAVTASGSKPNLETVAFCGSLLGQEFLLV
jgi:hypothetical protein